MVDNYWAESWPFSTSSNRIPPHRHLSAGQTPVGGHQRKGLQDALEAAGQTGWMTGRRRRLVPFQRRQRDERTLAALPNLDVFSP